MSREPFIHPIFEPITGTWQYIVADTVFKEAVIIDPVLDFDKSNKTISTHSADDLLQIVSDNGFTISRILETHAHADHLTASRYLQKALAQRQPANKEPQVCIGKRIKEVQQMDSKTYNIPHAELTHAFDHLFEDDEIFNIGSLVASVIHLPGHTPDHVGYMVGSNVFTGDSIFNPDVGSARCDFPGGSAKELYVSMQKLLSLPPYFKLYTGHDYPPETREVPYEETGNKAVPYATVERQRRENKHVKQGTELEEFVSWRTDRDNGLAAPRLLLEALQVNLRGGRLPSSPDAFELASPPLSLM